MSDPREADNTQAGDCIVLLIDAFNPPTMDHYRAVEVLKTRPEVKHVWLCPISGDNDDHVRAMNSAFVADMNSSSIRVSYCTIALDKKMTDPQAAIGWVRAKFPYFAFRFASLSPTFFRDDQQSFEVFLGTAGTIPEGATPVVADKFLPVPADLKERIKAGSDESRNFLAPVWNYLQKHKLYRD